MSVFSVTSMTKLSGGTSNRSRVWATVSTNPGLSSAAETLIPIDSPSGTQPWPCQRAYARQASVRTQAPIAAM